MLYLHQGRRRRQPLQLVGERPMPRRYWAAVAALARSEGFNAHLAAGRARTLPDRPQGPVERLLERQDAVAPCSWKGCGGAATSAERHLTVDDSDLSAK